MNRNVMAIHPGALGDVLLAVPAIKTLASEFPRHKILFIARASIGRLLAECRVIDEWIPMESQICSGLFAGFGNQSMELRSRLERCDAAVAWTDDADGSLADVLCEYGVQKVWIQSPLSSALRMKHQRDRFLETIGEGSANGLGEDALRIPAHLIEEGRICLGRKGVMKSRSLVLVHPGSGSIHKCLRPEKLADIIDQLQHRKMAPLLLEGPADQDMVEGVLRLLSKKPPVLRDLELSLLAGVLMHTDLYFGHDSGVTHLAALLGVRTVAVFGPTDHHRWAPQGRHVTILRGGSCACPTWQAVKNCHEKSCLDLPIEELLTELAFGVDA
jgi:heptosyltransferase III